MIEFDLNDIKEKLDAYKSYLRNVRIQEAWDEICSDHGSGVPSINDRFTVHLSADDVLTVRKSKPNAHIVERGEQFDTELFPQKKLSPSFLCVFFSNQVSGVSDDIFALFSNDSVVSDFYTQVKGTSAKHKAIEKLKRNLSRLQAANEYSAALEDELSSCKADNKHSATPVFKEKSKRFVNQLCHTDNSTVGQILLRAIISCLGFMYCAPASMSYGCSFWSRTRHEQIKTKVDLAVRKSSLRTGLAA